MTIELFFERQFELFTKEVYSPPGQLVVEVGNDEVESYRDLNMHTEWLTLI